MERSTAYMNLYQFKGFNQHNPDVFPNRPGGGGRNDLMAGQMPEGDQVVPWNPYLLEGNARIAVYQLTGRDPGNPELFRKCRGIVHYCRGRMTAELLSARLSMLERLALRVGVDRGRYRRVAGQGC